MQCHIYKINKWLPGGPSKALRKHTIMLTTGLSIVHLVEYKSKRDVLNTETMKSLCYGRLAW